jgi:hypothetical protein
MLLRFTCSCGGFRTFFRLVTGVGLVAGPSFGLRTAVSFGGQGGFCLRPLAGMSCKLMLGFGSCLRRGSRFGLRQLFLAHRFGGSRFRVGSLTQCPFRVMLDLSAPGRLFDCARFRHRALGGDGFSTLFRLEQGLRDFASLGFGGCPRLRLCLCFAFGQLPRLCGALSSSIRFRAFPCCGLRCAVGLGAGQSLLLQLGFGTFARTRRFKCLFFGCGTRFGGFHSACFRSGFGACHGFSAPFGLRPRSRLPLKIGFRLSTRTFGFQRFLLCRRPGFGGLGGTRFCRSARLCERFSGAVSFSASGSLLLRLGFCG